MSLFCVVIAVRDLPRFHCTPNVIRNTITSKIDIVFFDYLKQTNCEFNLSSELFFWTADLAKEMNVNIANGNVVVN